MKMGNTTGHKARIKTKLKNFRVKAGNMWMRTNKQEAQQEITSKTYFT